MTDTQPRTELDERFSVPDAAAVDWPTTQRLIAEAQLFWLSTVRPDGRPHVTPLVAVWLDDALHFSTGPTEQKHHNLEHNPQVVLTTGTNDWDRGTDVVVEGSAVRVTDRPTLERLAAAWRQKWDGQWQFDIGDDAFTHDHGTANVFAVRPTKVLAFGKQPPSHTRHMFDR